MRKQIAALILSAAALPAAAEEIRILSAAAMQTVFKEIADDFERQSGHRLVISYATMGAIPKRLLGGEAADVVVGSTPSMAQLAEQGRISAHSLVTIAKVGVGVVVPEGTPVPRISTDAELRDALLAARLVVYADPAGGGAAGIHVAKVIEKLGLTERLKPKTRFGAGGDVTEVTLAQGPGALGLTQISEIVDKPGALFVGPLPDRLQNYTGVTAGTPIAPRQPEAVRAFFEYLKSPAALSALRARGMQPS